MDDRTEPLILPESAVQDGDAVELIESTIEIVNILTRRGVPHAVIAPAALTSYAIDYYIAQIENGGFAQFIHNSGADPATLETVGLGLRGIGAKRHAALFETATTRLEALPRADLDAFLRGGFYGETAAGDLLNRDAEAFFALDGVEDVRALNAAWLRRHPELIPVPDHAFEDALNEIIDRHAPAEAPVRVPNDEAAPNPATGPDRRNHDEMPPPRRGFWSRMLRWLGLG